MPVYVKNITSTNYICTIQELLDKNILSPECQRPIDDAHVQSFYNYQVDYYKKNGELIIVHNIVLCNFEKKEYTMDGQHRIKALRLLRKLIPSDVFSKSSILVTMLYANSKEELNEKFILCNKNKPLSPKPPYYKPIEQYLRDTFGKYHKNTMNPRGPNWNIDNIVKKMEFLEFHNYITQDELIEEINTIQQYYKKNIQHIPKNSRDGKILKSKSKQDNYLVLSLFTKMEWISSILYKKNNMLLSYDNIPDHSHSRIRISPILRQNVWKKRNTMIDGDCYCCNSSIQYNNFECGHIVSVFCRGDTTLNNLEPICSSCNKDMGIQHLEEYRKRVRVELGL